MSYKDLLSFHCTWIVISAFRTGTHTLIDVTDKTNFKKPGTGSVHRVYKFKISSYKYCRAVGKVDEFGELSVIRQTYNYYLMTESIHSPNFPAIHTYGILVILK